MLTLEEIKATTANIHITSLPPINNEDWTRKIKALQEAHLYDQMNRVKFEARVWQAEQLGFVRLTGKEAVTMLMGKPPTFSMKELDQTHRHEYLYDHVYDTDKHTSFLFSSLDGFHPTDFYRYERRRWFPLTHKKVWTCRMGSLGALAKDIPYGVVLRVNEVKNLKLFNAFTAVAPIELWLDKPTPRTDPIVLATIYANTYNVEKAAHFFLAQW
jgi:hypothetical protein